MSEWRLPAPVGDVGTNPLGRGPIVPSEVDVATFASRLGIVLEESELAQWHASVTRVLSAYETVARLAAEHPRGAAGRAFVDVRSQDPWGAWRVRTSIPPTSKGILNDRTIAVKDNIGIAGVPLSNGSRALEAYVPDVDAIVVDRILAAGGEIAGTAVCEAFCLSGVSHTSATGPVRNPYDLGRSAGGSSSGAAVLVATGQVDMAIGGDQGGSIRLPASACGIMGLKPTFGLVPYGGAISVEPSLDHLGPMARTTEDLALLLTAIVAGSEGAAPSTEQYMDALRQGVRGLRIGMVREGFRHVGSDAVVDNAVRNAINALTPLGATVGQVSVPWHLEAGAVHNVVLTEGGASLLWTHKGLLPGQPGPYMHGLGRALGAAFDDPADLPDGVLALVVAGLWGHEDGDGEWYAMARQLVPVIRAAYDETFERFDVLALPTSVALPAPLPPNDMSRFEKLSLPRTGINTAPFNLTGHPALSVPCGQIDSVPIGMMLVAPHGGEATLLRVASAFEEKIYSCPAPPAQVT